MEFLLPLILLLPLVLITTRARKQQRRFAELQSGLRPGQAVVTTAGLHGTIHDIDGDVVLLDVADGVRLRWARAGIGQIVTPTAGAADLPDAGSSGATAADSDDRLHGVENDVDAAGERGGQRGA